MYLILAAQEFTLLKDASGAKCKKCQRKEGKNLQPPPPNKKLSSQSQLNTL